MSLGICAGFETHIVFVQLGAGDCLVEILNGADKGEIGITGTPIGGLGLGLQFGLKFYVQVSNTDSLDQLSSWFTYLGATAGFARSHGRLLLEQSLERASNYRCRRRCRSRGWGKRRNRRVVHLGESHKWVVRDRSSCRPWGVRHPARLGVAVRFRPPIDTERGGERCEQAPQSGRIWVRTVTRQQAGDKEPASPDEGPVTYSNVAFVRMRRPFNSWVSWNHKPPRSPKLSVRAGNFEVSAPQGMLLESRHFVIQSSGATMWRDRVGWAGTSVNRKECIRVPQRVTNAAVGSSSPSPPKTVYRMPGKRLSILGSPRESRALRTRLRSVLRRTDPFLGPTERQRGRERLPVPQNDAEQRAVGRGSSQTVSAVVPKGHRDDPHSPTCSGRHPRRHLHRHPVNVTMHAAVHGEKPLTPRRRPSMVVAGLSSGERPGGRGHRKTREFPTGRQDCWTSRSACRGARSGLPSKRYSCAPNW